MSESHKIAEPFVFYTKVIPTKLIDYMVEELEELSKKPHTFKDAEVGGDLYGRKDTQIRNSKLNWWYEEHWACSIFSHYIGLANKQYWEYDLSFLESIQITVYNETGHYNWHSDYGTGKYQNFTRKLSASLIVNDPEEYEGGDLEFIDYHGKKVIAPREKGTIIVFDSRIPHKVTPITSGRRVSLVTWMYGPKLR